MFFYNDGDANNNRNVYLFEGNDSNAQNAIDADGWNATLSGFTWNATGQAKLLLHIGDGQTTKLDAQLSIIGSPLVPAGHHINGDSVPAGNPGSGYDFNYVIQPGHETGGRLWDIEVYENFQTWLTSGSPSSLQLQSGVLVDYWNLVLAMVDLPAGNTPGDCEGGGGGGGGNATPTAMCPTPLTIEANADTGVPSVTLTTTVSDAEGDPLTVQWFFIPRAGDPQQLIRTDNVVFPVGSTSANLSLTFSALAPQSANRIIITVSDGQAGHSPIVCEVGITTIEPAPPTLEPGADLVFTAEVHDGRYALPDLHSYYVVQSTPAPGQAITGWDNHSQTVATLLLTYIPPTGTRFPVGRHPITLGLTDEALNSTSGTKYMVVNRASGNRPPEGVDDAATTRINTPSIISVISNDSDVDSDPIAVVASSLVGGSVQGGSLLLNLDGSITYTPASGFSGLDTFTYQIIDAPPVGETPLTTTVNVNVLVIDNNTPPLALNDSFTTSEDVSLAILYSQILLNDSDADGDGLTVSPIVLTTPASGTLSSTAVGWIYTPGPNFVGADSFVYEVSDGFGGTASATVILNVTPINDPPVASDDSASTSGAVVTVPILSNDTDVDGGALVVTGANYLGSTGSILLNPDGTLVYTPGPTFVGVDLIIYTISDGAGGTDTATVTITVRGGNGGGQSLTAVNDSLSTVEDAPPTGYIEILLSTLFSNDTSANGTINFVSQSGVSHGTLTGPIAGTGGQALIYTPHSNYSGTDSFTYTINNGAGVTSTAQVLITITPSEDPPIANPDSLTVNEDSAGTPVSVLVNDFDPDAGQTVSLISANPPSHGGVVISGNTVVYTPTPNYSGLDSFTYQIASSGGGTAVGVVNVIVNPINDPPTIPAGAETTFMGVPITRSLNGADIDGDALSYSVVFGPSVGNVVINAGGTYTFTPPIGFVGTATFTVRVSDGRGGIAEAVIVVNVVGGPIAVNDSASTQQGVAVSIAVLSNDSDPDNAPNVLTVVSATSVSGNASVTVNLDGSVLYTPQSGFFGVDTFTYIITDGQYTASATVTIEVNGRPIAQNQSLTLQQDTSFTGNLLGSDPDGDPITFGPPNIVTLNGNVTVSSSGVFVYTPNTGYTGPDSFSFTVDDGRGGVSVGSVTIVVTPVGGGCDLYPIALHVSNVEATPVGGVLDIYSGANPGNFGWLSWAGPLKEPTLVTSLTIPGDSHTYINPLNPTDHQVSVGDFVEGSTGVKNSSAVRGRLDILKTIDIIVPVWDQVNDNGANTVYRVWAFAKVRILEHNLSKKWIKARFLGLTQCGGVNPPPPNLAPNATNDEITIDEDNSAVIDVLNNDSDPEGQSLSVVSVTTPGSGSVSINSNGTVTFVPGANFYGVVSFNYTITDGSLSDSATVTINVCAVNDPPGANNLSKSTQRDIAVSGKLTATDIDGGSLVFGPTGHRLTAHGAVDISANGNFVYVPEAGYVGTDTFQFTVNDGRGGTAQATVTITIQSPPPGLGCDLYPITLPIGSLKNLPIGNTVDIYAGCNPGNFGWLTWAGSMKEPVLHTSLGIPGDSFTYVNPYNQNDHRVSVGDWVRGSTGVKNSSEVRARLDALKSIDIVVPVWKSVVASGSNVKYKVINFARVRILDYQLANQNRITARFLGFSDCDDSGSSEDCDGDDDHENDDEESDDDDDDDDHGD